jgi:GNAT superfamily N-acetyltransferase
MIVRRSVPADWEFVMATAERLGASGPSWRTPSEVVEGELRTLQAHFDGHSPGSTLLVAEPEPGTLLGFVFLETHHDYFTQEEHGHVGVLAVTEGAEGQGIAALLIDAAEAWARERRYRLLTLNVFDRNRHARDVYEHLGYRPETVKYVKLLEEPGRLPWSDA